jgi:hypothetical protein
MDLLIMLLRIALLLLSLAAAALVLILAEGNHQHSNDELTWDMFDKNNIEGARAASPSDKDDLYNPLANFNAYHHMYPWRTRIGTISLSLTPSCPAIAR